MSGQEGQVRKQARFRVLQVLKGDPTQWTENSTLPLLFLSGHVAMSKRTWCFSDRNLAPGTSVFKAVVAWDSRAK